MRTIKIIVGLILVMAATASALVIKTTPSNIIYNTGGFSTFNGSDESAKITDGTQSGLDLGTTDFVIRFWFKTTSTADSRLVFKTQAGDNGYGIWLSPAVPMLRFRCRNAVSEDASTTSAYNDGVWYHVVCVRESGGTNIIYVDGVNAGSVSDTGLDLDNTGDFRVATAGTDKYYDGNMSELAVYNPSDVNVDWDAAGVLADYQRGRHRGLRLTTNLVSYWRLDELESDTTFTDDQGSNDLTDTNMTDADNCTDNNPVINYGPTDAYIDGDIQATGDVTANGDMGATGNLNIGGNSTITGNSTAASSTVAGNSEVSGDLKNDTVTIFYDASKRFYGAGGFYVGTVADSKLIDDSSTGVGTTTLYIGNETIDTTPVSAAAAKKDIVDTAANIDILLNISVKDYKYKKAFTDDDATIHTGMIADDLVSVTPYAVKPYIQQTNDPNVVVTLNYIDMDELIPLMIKSIQDLQKQIDDLKQLIQ